MKHIDALAEHQDTSADRTKERELALGELTKADDLNDITAILRSLANSLTGATGLERAEAREAAIAALKGKLRAPAKLVDGALADLDSVRSESEAPPPPGVLVDPEPWPGPVSGLELLAELEAAILRYIVTPWQTAVAAALWTLHAHALEAFSVSAFLLLSSPERRCGKSRFLEVLQHLVPRPLPAANLTPAALFRALDAWSPTLLIDEADTFLAKSDELRGLLNSGHTRGSAYVLRVEEQNGERVVRYFGTWGAKAVALIGSAPATIEDRSILIPMRRKKSSEKVERFRPDRVDNLEELRRRAARWALDNLDALRELDPSVPEGLHDRAADNWEPLLAIADLAGGEWPQRARKAAGILSVTNEEESLGVELLRDIRAIFDARNGDDRIFTDTLLEDLYALDSRPWNSFRASGLPISGYQVAKLLRPFEVRPRQIRCGSMTRKGYHRKSFTAAWERYTHPPKHPRKRRNKETTPASGANGDGERFVVSDVSPVPGGAVDTPLGEERTGEPS